jgi:hypothetical protein
MMFLSCGHREDDWNNHHNVMLKEWSGNQRAVAYKCVCPFCFANYKNDELLFTDEEALKWMIS